jgi:hypothetical protein
LDPFDDEPTSVRGEVKRGPAHRAGGVPRGASPFPPVDTFSVELVVTGERTSVSVGQCIKAYRTLGAVVHPAVLLTL